MRLLVGALFIVVLVACGETENSSDDPTPTTTPNERIERWADTLSQRLFDGLRGQSPSICELINESATGGGSGGFIEDVDITSQIPPEELEKVTVLTMEKMQEKCADEITSPSAPSN